MISIEWPYSGLFSYGQAPVTESGPLGKLVWRKAGNSGYSGIIVQRPSVLWGWNWLEVQAATESGFHSLDEDSVSEGPISGWRSPRT